VSAKWRELVQELRSVFGGRTSLVDAVIPPISFVILNALLGLAWAIGGSLLAALILTLLRLSRGQALKYALGGLGVALLAILSAVLLDSAEAYFVPDVIGGALILVACGASVMVGRPLVAWTSHIVRRWPLGWYWHPMVRPAYSEVTLAWMGFYALKLALQVFLLREGQAGALAAIQVIMGWPATIGLLVLSYLYGLWRLQQLRGPSVAEFRVGAEPPWTGQRRGF
jgi:hypothetical protein